MASAHKLYKILVNQLPWTVSKHELKAYFAKYGYVKEANVVFDNDTGLSKLYGHVVFIDKTAYNSVLQTPIHKIDDERILVRGTPFESEETKKNNN